MNTTTPAHPLSLLAGKARPDCLRHETLADLFRATARQAPGKAALIFEDSALTYAALDRWSDAIAASLAEAGLGRGDKIGVWWPRGTALHACILGIVKSGAAYVPIDREQPAERVELVMQEVRAAALFSETALNIAGRLLSVPPLPGSDEVPLPPPGPQPDDDAYVLYTSGSTGKPKGIPIRHRSICHLARAEQTVLGVTANDRVYQGFSVSFDMWCEEVWISYLAGATLWVADATTAKAVDELTAVLRRADITVLHAVPSLLAVMEADLPALRLVNAGGEACTPQVLARWAEGRLFFNSYGPTETTVTSNLIRLRPGMAITIGDPLPNYGVAVVDDAGNPVPRGERGELVISGPGLSAGYVSLPELTAEKFLPKPAALDALPGERIYRSGDAVLMQPDGSIEFLGRFDDQVKWRGYRIELGEVEARLGALPGVSAAAVALKQDAAGADHLVGYVVAEAEACVNESDLRLALSHILPAYMLPSVIVALRELPRMPSGKVDRRNLPLPEALKVVAADADEKAIDLQAPVADRMWAVLGQLFPGRQLPEEPDFFNDLGGHSLLAAGFISRMRRDAGLPHASLKDIYTHRPLSALARHWEATAVAAAPPQRAFLPVAPLRYFTCWLVQSFVLLVVYGLYAVQLFTPFVSYYYFSELQENYSSGIPYAILFYCLIPPLYTALVVSAKWLIIGKMKAGDYPLWGSYYLRWWTVKTLQRLVPESFVAGTPLYPRYLRLFGMKVAPDAQVNTLTTGAYDLVTIGSDASLSSSVVINNAWVEEGLLKLRPVHIGAHCYIGSSAVLGGSTHLEDWSELQDLSYLPEGTVTQVGEVWQGSPAQRKETKAVADLPHPDPTPPATSLRFGIHFGLLLFIFPVFVLLPLLPIIVTIHYLDNAAPDYNFDYIIIVPALSLFYILLFAAETILFTRLLNQGIRPGTYSIYSARYVRKWLADQFFSVSLIVLHPLYATVYISGFYRALGARIGRNTEVSTASSVTHPLLSIGDDAFVADAATLGEADVRAQKLILDHTSIGNNSFVGNSALIPQGCRIPSNLLIGVLSVPPPQEEMTEGGAKDYFGSPAIALPQRQQSNPFPKTLTTSPTSVRRFRRALVEAFRVILPESVIIVCSILFIAYSHQMLVDHPWWKVVLRLPLYYLGFVGVPALLVTVLLKWLLAGRYKAGQHPMWTSRVWRSEAVTTTYEALAVPYLLDFLRGTPWLPLALRLMGVRFGKRVWLNTTDITEHDMVRIGTDTALNEDCGPQTHLFEDRVMKIGAVRIGDRVSIGARSIVLYDTQIGNDVKIEALSLVMKGELLAPHTAWTGSPIRPQ